MGILVTAEWAGSSAEGRTATRMQIFVKSLAGRTLLLDLAADAGTNAIKAAIQDQEGIPEQCQRLVFAGKQIEDGRSLAHYSIAHGASLNLCLSLDGGGKKKKKKKKKKDDEPAE